MIAVQIHLHVLRRSGWERLLALPPTEMLVLTDAGELLQADEHSSVLIGRFDARGMMSGPLTGDAALATRIAGVGCVLNLSSGFQRECRADLASSGDRLTVISDASGTHVAANGREIARSSIGGWKLAGAVSDAAELLIGVGLHRQAADTGPSVEAARSVHAAWSALAA